MSTEDDTKIIELINASAKKAFEGGEREKEAVFHSLEFFPPRTAEASKSCVRVL